jgi:hypothetical protein
LAASSVFERVVAALFGGGQPSADTEAERQLIADTIEAVVAVVEPRVRLHKRYREKLEGCVRHSIAYLRSIGRERLDPVPLTRAAWSSDPRVNASGVADDVPACLGRSRSACVLQKPANADVQEAMRCSV